MSSLKRRGLVFFLLMLGTAWPTLPASETGDVVRDDWYFRQSLPAIDDWEQILDRWEQETAEEERTPIMPVPENGQAVRWPNPLPLPLLPGDDREHSVGVRLLGDKMQIERVGKANEATKTLAATGEVVLGYKHPGGGGKDQWYHAYHRRFDRLCTFRPKPAPFAVRLDGPLDLKRGPNELELAVSNTSEGSLTITARLQWRSPAQTQASQKQELLLSREATQRVRFPVELDGQGGGLLVLTLDAAGESYWLPILTHVEEVNAVLEGIRQILDDTPNATFAKSLADLRRRADEWDSLGATGATGRTETWRDLFEEASRFRDELLLERVSFDSLLLLRRKPFFSEQPFMDAHHLYNRPGGGVYRLSPVHPEGKVTTIVDSLGEGVYRDVCLHWDARKFLFSFGNGSDKWDGRQSYHIYEAGVDGSRITQLTSGPKNDCEPFYLPNGQIGFTSDRSEHFVMCGGDRHSPTLFVMEGDGSGVRQLSFNVFNDFNPTVLPDGRILYSRWEYNERSVTALHNPFTMNPDGTMVAPYYGNATIRPNVVMFPRPVPRSRKVMALFTAHHGQTHGSIGLIDVRRGIDGPDPLTILTPNVPVTGEKAEDSRHGWFSDPVPLSESTYLCSFTPTVLPWLERSWGLYVGDRHGNLALVFRDAEISCAEPVPLAPRPRPHGMPPAPPNADAPEEEATLLLADAYVGLTGVPRGVVRYLRILEDVPRKSVTYGGVICTSGTEIFTIKRIFGTVPIEPDGSAHFVVPANRNVYFEVLDEDYREIQRMRSVVCLKPNERRACVGCHESRGTAPPNTSPTALYRAPSRPQPPPWGTKIVSFLRDVQPLLNEKCVACHTHDRMANRLILTDDLTDQFTVAYEELLPWISVANANRWDHPDDVHARFPLTYGSKVSRLVQVLAEGHHGLQLAADHWQRLINWIDANGVYYDRYEQAYGSKRRIFTGSVRQTLDAAYERRCARCHGHGDGRLSTWWLSLNRHDVTMSRSLAAPLARSAGGWGRCDPAVFNDADDPDYKMIKTALANLAGRLRNTPRADLLSIRGSQADNQQVELPPPPETTTAMELPEDGWVYLSDLPWVSARSGWTPNKDGLPRLDRDVSSQPMRFGPRTYRKGIGTHAPSEIVYRLDRRYVKFHALVGGAEAGGTVVFQVFADGKQLVDTGLMHGLGGVKTIDVSVEGAEVLKLVVTDAGDGYNSDMANWADARLQLAE